MKDQPKPASTYQVSFNGSGSEYFRIWIVNVVLTVLSLSIYSAWAKVRSKRYFYGNTVIDRSSFEYHATGLQILYGRLIAVALLLVIVIGQVFSPTLALVGYALFLALLPWAVCRSQYFNARMSSYRNLRFGFSGKAKAYYLYVLLLPILPIVVALAIGSALVFSGVVAGPESLTLMFPVVVPATYAMIPYVQGKIVAYTINHSEYGVAKFSASISPIHFIKIYLDTALIGSALFAALAVIAFLITLVAAGLIGRMAGALSGASFSVTSSILVLGMVLLGSLAVAAAGSLVRAYQQSRLRNYQLNNTKLNNEFEFKSDLTARGLWNVEFTNYLFLIITLGLAYPWTAVRKVRYLVSQTRVVSSGNIEQFVAGQGNLVSSIGDELGEAFDVDIAAGF